MKKPLLSVRKIKNSSYKRRVDQKNKPSIISSSVFHRLSVRKRGHRFKYLIYSIFLCMNLVLIPVSQSVSAMQPPADAKGKNVIKEEKTCPKGKYLNPETKRCKKFPEQKVKTCKKGYFLNVKTNRCNKNPAPKKPSSKKPGTHNSGSKKPNFNNSNANNPGAKNPSSNNQSPQKPGSNTSKQPGGQTNIQNNKNSQPKTCLPGYFLNKATNRCNKIVNKVPKTCRGGYFLNKITNRCNKKQEVNEKKPCKAGQVRNPETGRCHKIAGPVAPKTCPEGKVLNPETNRCKKPEQTKELKACKEGYERHPETNRCRKIHQNTGATNPVEVPKTGESEEKKKKDFNGTTAVAGSAAIGLGIAVFQFKDELFIIIRKIFLHK